VHNLISLTEGASYSRLLVQALVQALAQASEQALEQGQGRELVPTRS